MTFVYYFFATIVAYFVKGMTGFANTLVVGTLCSFVIPNKNITPVDLLLGVPSNLYMAWKERKRTALKTVIPLTLIIMAAIVPSALFLKVGNERVIKMLFGVVVIGLAVEMFLRERAEKRNFKHPAFWMVVIGLGSGVLLGLFGIGALLVAYVSRATENNGEFRGTICTVFVLENIFRIILYSCMGIITWTIVKTAIFLIPALIIGLKTGMAVEKRVSEKTAKRVICLMLLLTGVSLFVTNLLG